VRRLAGDLSAWASGRPSCIRACERLEKAVSSVNDPELPTAEELSRIASAMERVSCAVTAGGPVEKPAPAPRRQEPPPTETRTVITVPTEGISATAAGDTPVETAPEDEPVETAPEDEPVETAPEDEPVETAPEDAHAAVTEEPMRVAPQVQTASDTVDIAGLPTRLIHSARAITPAQRRRWPTFRDVPPPSTLPRRQERRLAEVVTALLEQTADIGRRALTGEDRATLQAALDELWKTRFEIDKLARPLRVEDAIALHDRGRVAGGEP
jgi:hypothetical protein